LRTLCAFSISCVGWSRGSTCLFDMVFDPGPDLVGAVSLQWSAPRLSLYKFWLVFMFWLCSPLLFRTPRAWWEGSSTNSQCTGKTRPRTLDLPAPKRTHLPLDHGLNGRIVESRRFIYKSGPRSECFFLLGEGLPMAFRHAIARFTLGILLYVGPWRGVTR